MGTEYGKKLKFQEADNKLSLLPVIQFPNKRNDITVNIVTGRNILPTFFIPPLLYDVHSQYIATAIPICGFNKTKNKPAAGGMMNPRTTSQSILLSIKL